MTPLTTCWMSRSARIGIFSFMPTGPAKPTGAPVTCSITSGVASSSFVALRARRILPSLASWSPRTKHGDRLAVGHVDQRLDELVRLALQERADLLDRAGARRGHFRQAASAARSGGVQSRVPISAFS